MDSPILFISAVGLCIAALLVLVVVVLKPRNGSLPLDRRRIGTVPDDSAVGRVSQSAVQFVDAAIGRSGGLFNREVLYKAGVKQAPADFTVIVAISTVIIGVLGSFLINLIIGIVLAIATPFVAKLILVVKTEKRRAKFETQLTDTIQMLIGGLRVGHSIMRSLESVALEAQAPTSEELSRIVNEVRIGKDARQAIEDCADRMDSEDFRWIGQAIQINREVGGDLAEVLEQVAGTIRERSEIKGHVRSLSAEGKMSAYILMALPVGVGLILTIMNPGYMKVFAQHPVGIALLVAAGLLFVIGGFWMSRTVKIKF
ncbi:type II secretion system F family protein [Paenarthrobacter aromaticivorans]|uniref:Type II secretion system F family protein n=1 Tax=Paenarthrobacter aromaticivorans TaxID=2849150 RepID=A0ABS6I5G2_9MICC|nr:type II secretion system F family protein [Paenarthrobacter sp. MMS21-TAE1-1]MBU8866968.1 type II secretion system F family protein [Paenarthrobacter sp. MMS21-TAE1-1]